MSRPSGRIGLAALLAVAGLAAVVAFWPRGAPQPAAAQPQAFYDEGASVVVTATPKAGYQLAAWGGDCASTPASSATCTLTMDGDRTASATFAELTCESGMAAPNPTLNSELVADCARLLALRDTLAGTGALNWTAGTAMTSWTGVTVGGSPRRVTELQLANQGLNGEILGWLGDLTALTELRLNGNQLTGRVPSKLGQLTNLTHLYISGNSFTGCLPPAWENVANSDLASLSPTYCDPPIDVSFAYPVVLEGGNTYLWRMNSRTSPIIFDIPPGLRFHGIDVELAQTASGADAAPLLIFSSVGSNSNIVINHDTGLEYGRRIEPSTSSGATADALSASFDRFAASVWFATPTIAVQAAHMLALATVENGALTANPEQATYDEGATVVITATPKAGYRLAAWGGDCASTPASSATCTLTMDADKTVSATFADLTCESGTAVPNPSANSELVNDCRRLLALRDTLAGTGALNWTAGTALTSWAGVTVGGSPRRVTKLQLANNGLTGQVSGLVGELAGLTELRLNGNRLTGRLPSKLAQLTKLTHAYIAGNALTGCAPPLLRTVANNDVAQLGLADCPAPVDISYYQGDEILAAGTYQFIWIDGDPPLIFDIPEGLRMRVWGSFVADREEGPPLKGLVLEDAETGRSWIGLDVQHGAVYEQHVESTERATLFDRIGESLWIGSREVKGK